jgi:hypothetical protein
MGKKMTFLGFVGWYVGSFVVSLALLVGLLCLWGHRYAVRHAAEVRENAAYFARENALEDAWRHREAPEAVRTPPKAKKTPSRVRTGESEDVRQARQASRCWAAACTYDIRDSMKVPQ